jgi:hypothetical protein
MGNLLNRTVFLLVLLCSVFQGFSQAIHGIVLDKNTKEPIPFATIYFNGTFSGTSANNAGEFSLSWKEDKPRPITATSVGYYSMTLFEYQIDSLVFISLEPKVYDIPEVIIKPDKMPRAQKEKMFREEFLGKDNNATRCKIENMKDIILVYNDRNKSLTAYCDKPVIINNNALKYRIYYFLDQFKSSKDSAFMGGTCYFNEIPHRNKKAVAVRRNDAYLGSRMHFIRSLWENRLSEEGFDMKIVDSCKMGYNSILLDSTEQEKFFSLCNNVIVTYPKKLQRSMIFLNKKSITIDKSGYYDPHGIRWAGFMASQRMADLLPYEYEAPDSP